MEYEKLHEKLRKLTWLLHRVHMRNHAEHGPVADPMRGQGRVIALLKMQNEASAKELAALLGIRQQSLNELLRKLEKNGYVDRIPSESDKRVILVRLTEKGKSGPSGESESDYIRGCLNAEESKIFGECLDRITSALEVQLGGEGDKNLVCPGALSETVKKGHSGSVRHKYGEQGGARPRGRRYGLYEDSEDKEPHG